MTQLFSNLVNNAIKFRKAGVPPVIRVEAKLMDSSSSSFNSLDLNSARPYYEITVTDNGIGFDNKYAEKIFTIFQRLHGRTEYKGTGIGLAICRKICTNHEGFITASSDGVNGSIFKIILPK
jgi:signal transduction histidine kinase